MLELIVVLFLIAAVIAWSVGMIILNGWALTVLWGWFVVPFGVPSLTIAWAVGIIILANFLKGNSLDLKKEKESKESWGKLMAVVAQSLLRTGFTLGIGWIVHTFI